MTDTAQAAETKPAAFDPQAYIRDANVTEQARREGKPIETKPVESAAPAKAAEPAPAGGHAARSGRRVENRLREELGAERGRRELLEQQLAERKPADVAAAAAIEDLEPLRKNFATDAEFLRASTAWDTRQGTKKAAADAETAAANEASLTALRAEIAASDAQAIEDKKLIPDFDQVAQADIDNPDRVDFNPADHPLLMRMFATSDVKAFLLHHLALHPEEMEGLLDLTGNPERQVSTFRRLEGRLERARPAKDAKADPAKAAKAAEPAKAAEETAAERDARKAKPSEAGAPRGGSAPAMKNLPTLEDGRTMNPLWKAEMNERERARR